MESRLYNTLYETWWKSGADPGFQVRGQGGRSENFWDISCEKSQFYAKKIFFFPIAEEGAKILGYFV
jgi:hypothetical protein